MAEELQEYQMLVHLFGAISSPACANFALRRTAEDNKKRSPSDVVNKEKRNFYVNDCFKSFPFEVGSNLLTSTACLSFFQEAVST